MEPEAYGLHSSGHGGLSSSLSAATNCIQCNALEIDHAHARCPSSLCHMVHGYMTHVSTLGLPNFA